MEIIEKDRCTGCGACYAACNHNAISMEYDEEGFEFSVINPERCVDCGLCSSSCPILHFDLQASALYFDCQRGYAAYNKNEAQRLISSSGGIFPPIAEWILDKDGIVVGTAFDSDFNAEHVVINSYQQLSKLQGSKYLQCKADTTTFRIIREQLAAGKWVLYAGLTCQVAGLKQFLRKDYEKLYTIDLICMGIPSPLVWQKYLHTFFAGETIKHVNFKEKSFGWDSFCVFIETDKRIFRERGMENSYLQSMFKTWNMRRSCFQCPFKSSTRISDFTLADCWGASSLVPQMNDNKGLSSVIVHSQKALRLWNELQGRVNMVEIPLQAIVDGNTNFVRCQVLRDGRKEFYKTLEKNPVRAFNIMCAVDKPSDLTRWLLKTKKIAKKLFSHFI